MAISSELDDTVTLKEKQRRALKAFLSRQHVFTQQLTAFGKSLITHRNALRLAKGQSHVDNVTPHTNMEPRAVAT